MAAKRARTERRYGSRPVRIQRPRPIVIVVCDDTRTAVEYFVQLAREVKASVTVRVLAAPRHGSTPDDVLNAALEAAQAFGISSRPGSDSVWALVDTEAALQQPAMNAQRRGDQHAVRVLISKPCYEVWTLAHLVDTGVAFGGCDAVLARLRAEWKRTFQVELGRKKAQADYARLLPLRSQAIERARRHGPDRDQSWTQVHEVVQAIDRLHLSDTPV